MKYDKKQKKAILSACMEKASAEARRRGSRFIYTPILVKAGMAAALPVSSIPGSGTASG